MMTRKLSTFYLRPRDSESWARATIGRAVRIDLTRLLERQPRVLPQALKKYPALNRGDKKTTTTTLRRDPCESSGSSTTPRQNHTASVERRKRALHRTSKKTLERPMAAPIDLTDASTVSRAQSILEEISVRERTRRTYRGASKSFVAFADREGLVLDEADAVDRAATAYMSLGGNNRGSENESCPL